MQTLIYAILGIGGGVALLVYTEPIKRFTGPMKFAEQHFGGGGTYTFYKILGLGMIIFTFLWLTGGIESCLPSFLFGGVAPQS